MEYTLTDEEFYRRLQSIPSLEETNAKKHQSACLSMSAAMISEISGSSDSQNIKNALLIWRDTESHRFNHSAITNALSLSYRSEKLIFVMTMSKEREYSALIRLNGRRLFREMHDVKNLASYLILGSKEKPFELLKMNLSASEFLSKYNELIDEGWICAALGCLPREHQGFRVDIESAHPTAQLNSHFGSIAAG
jgi:hypothetical protein